jgi:transcriptional regulator with XRE-family HTH domain
MSRTSTQPHRSATQPGQTLARATTRAAQLLGLSQAELARILGVSPATVSRMAAGRYVLQREQKAWELAALFVRMFRSLDALVGANDAQARAWLASPNRALGGEPRSMLAQTEGLVRVVHYLDAARGRI